MPTTDLVQTAPRSGSASERALAPEAMESVTAFPIFVPDDGEFRAMREVVGQWRRMRDSQGIGEVVETGSEVMQKISDEHTEIVVRWLFAGDENFQPPHSEINSAGGRPLWPIDKDFPSEVVSGHRVGVRVPRGDRTVPSGIRVVFVPDGVVVTAQPPDDLGLQLCQVLERSSQLQFMVESHATP
jgi:hypothetical protein